VRAAAVFLPALLLAGPARAAEPLSIRPSETDRRISKFDSPHLAWVPTAAEARSQLLVFLPGTGGSPGKADLPHSFAETAAELGYHVVSLMYPDNVAAQIACGKSPDIDCQMKFRNAILRGGAIGPRRTIPRHDSVESRLEKLVV